MAADFEPPQPDRANDAGSAEPPREWTVPETALPTALPGYASQPYPAAPQPQQSGWNQQHWSQPAYGTQAPAGQPMQSNWPNASQQWYLAQTVAGAVISDPAVGDITLQRRGVGDILSLAIRFARARIGSLWLYSLLIVSPVVIVVQFLGLWITKRTEELTSSVAIFDAQATQDLAWTVAAGSALILYLSVVTSIIAATLAMRSAGQTMLADFPDQVARIGTIRRAVGISVLYSLVLVLAVAIPTVVLVGLAFVEPLTLIATIPISVGVFIFIPFWVMALIPVSVTEGLSVSEARRRSKFLRKESFGRLFGLIFLIRVINWVLSAVLSLPGFVAGLVVDNQTVVFSIDVVVALFVAVFDVVVTGFAISIWYFDTRIRREAFDVQVLSAQMTKLSAEEA